MADPAALLPEHFPFWDWSLAIYARVGVAEACLGLQDRHGVDVNLVLFAVWLAVDGCPLGDDATTAATTLARLAGDAGRWQVEMIQPLRSCRRAARSAGAALPPRALERLRDALKALELEAERHEQWLLYQAAVALLPPGAPGAGSVQLARRHLDAVALRSGITWTGDDAVALATLVDTAVNGPGPGDPARTCDGPARR